MRLKDELSTENFMYSLRLTRANRKNYYKVLYGLSNNIEKNYTDIYINKRNKKEKRHITVPNKYLKNVQRKILYNYLMNLAVSKYAIAYKSGRSIVDNASPHINQNMIVKLDIKDFFNNINTYQVYSSCFVIKQLDYKDGMILAKLCTLNNALPQGAPTSPYISNIVMKYFDDAIGNYCENNNINYSRYSDDMTFSGDNIDVKALIKIVKQNLFPLGLSLNVEKTHVVFKSHSQNVTGIIVNEKPQVAKSYRKHIRQEIYYIKKFGIESHMDKLKLKSMKKRNSYLNKLYGRILYVLQVNPNDKEFIEYRELLKKWKNPNS